MNVNVQDVQRAEESNLDRIQFVVNVDKQYRAGEWQNPGRRN